MQADPLRDEEKPNAAGAMESGMRTGQGADDEPEMTIGDKFAGADEEEDAGDVASAAAVLGAEPSEEGQQEE